MKKIILIICLIFIGATANSQNMEGVWHGILKANGTSLYLVFNIEKENGELTGTMDSPLQNSYGIALSSVEYMDGEVILKCTRMGMTYKGTLNGDDTITGNFKQGLTTAGLNLTRLTRPQEPIPPFPYRTKDVVFRNEAANADLAGTLTLPTIGKAPYPAVILVSGSGLQDRNEELFGHKPFLVIADYLTRQGIAVLRYDDRGHGESTGDLTHATTMDFAEDAMCGIDFLLSHPDIDPERIGIMGHSEGGTIALIVGARKPEIAFAVSLAGAAVSGRQILIDQNHNYQILRGASQQEADTYCEILDRIFELHITVPFEQIADNLERYTTELFTEEVNDILPPASRTNLKHILKTEINDWLSFFIGYDPQGDIKAIKCPVFALNGTKDTQVDAEMNLEAIKAALTEGGNTNFKIKSYDSLNHLFQHAGTGGIEEYGFIAETVSPEVLEDIAAWIGSVTTPQ